jgi:iron-sulfur cluster repair protein YtfE (RIC family)
MTLKVGHRHHAELLPHVDELRRLADDVAQVSGVDLRARLGAEMAFIDEQLIPHMEMAEQHLYPELERLLEDPRAMAPMRREHEAMRHLLSELRELSQRLPDGAISLREELVLRRVLYRLFAMLQVHLGEEERYLAIIDRNTGDVELRGLIEGMHHAGSVSL